MQTIEIGTTKRMSRGAGEKSLWDFVNKIYKGGRVKTRSIFSNVVKYVQYNQYNFV